MLGKDRTFALLISGRIADYAKKYYSHLDHVNSEDTFIDYKDSRFFVIKSYSEEDVHKSMKYQVWSSTLEGNKRLNEAYRKCSEAKIPIFLFFRHLPMFHPQ